MGKRARITAVTALAVTIVCVYASAQAGPPLLCHPIDIGDATSLPWGSGAWHNDHIKAEEPVFIAQTLALLSSQSDVLVRMETIRRAAIHCAEAPGAARTILASLREQVETAVTAGRINSAACFNYGYMLACCAQMNEVTDHNNRGVSGSTRRALDIPEGANPYRLVQQAASASANDPAIEFALALITAYPRHDAHAAHLQKSIQGAQDGSLLAKNLVAHFGRQGQSLSELRDTYGAGDAERR